MSASHTTWMTCFPRTPPASRALAEQLARCVAILDEALEDPDPWHGFCSVIEKVCTMQASDRGFTAAFLSRFPDAIDYDRERTRAENGLARLVQRAKDVGQLRDDFDHTDITLLLLANSGIVGESQQVSLARPDAWSPTSSSPSRPATPNPCPRLHRWDCGSSTSLRPATRVDAVAQRVAGQDPAGKTLRSIRAAGCGSPAGRLTIRWRHAEWPARFSLPASSRLSRTRWPE